MSTRDATAMSRPAQTQTRSLLRTTRITGTSPHEKKEK